MSKEQKSSGYTVSPILRSITFVVFITYIFASMLFGCQDHHEQELQPSTENQREATIPSGSYDRILSLHMVSSGSNIPVEILPDLSHLEFDREGQNVVFTFKNNDRISASLNLAALSNSKGCPTNFGSTQMEVINLQEDVLQLGDVIFNRPVIIATCPIPPTVIVLRETGEGIDDILPGAACDWWNDAKCIYFGQDYIRLMGQIIDFNSNQAIPEGEISIS